MNWSFVTMANHISLMNSFDRNIFSVTFISFQVLFEDGRLMTVSYYVDGKSGFVPTITFEENYIPDFEV